MFIRQILKRNTMGAKSLIIIIVIFFQLEVDLCAQQTPQWTQYIFNQYMINPAYGGLDRSLSINMGVRTQWTEFEGAPNTQTINAHLPLYYLKGSAGIAITNDQAGGLRRTKLTMSYNYVTTSDLGLFSAGARLGFQQIEVDGSIIRTPDGIYTDGVFTHNDPILGTNIRLGYVPTWTLGGYFTNGVLSLGVTLENFVNNIEGGDSRYSEHDHFSFFGSYRINLNDKVNIKPNVLFKSDFVHSQLDIGLLGQYLQFYGGLSFRGYRAENIDALGVIVGSKVSEHVRISYAFDIGLSGLKTNHDGTHEFLFHYNLNKPIRTGEPPRIIYNPRYN